MSNVPGSPKGNRLTSQPSFVDLDLYGRGFDGIFGSGAEAAGRRSALLKQKKTQQAHFAEQESSYIEYDLYGRGDPRIFGENAHLLNAAEAEAKMPNTKTAGRKKMSLRAVIFPVREKFSNFRRKVSSRFSRKNRKAETVVTPAPAESKRTDPIAVQNSLATTPEARVAEHFNLTHTKGNDKILVSPDPHVTNLNQVRRMVQNTEDVSLPQHVSGWRNSPTTSMHQRNEFSQQSYGTAGIVSVQTVSVHSDTDVEIVQASPLQLAQIRVEDPLRTSASSTTSSSNTTSQDSDESSFLEEITNVQMATAVDEISSDEDVNNTEFVASDGSNGSDSTPSERTQNRSGLTVQEMIKDLNVSDTVKPAPNSSRSSGSCSENGSTSSEVVDFSSHCDDGSDSGVVNGESSSDDSTPIPGLETGALLTEEKGDSNERLSNSSESVSKMRSVHVSQSSSSETEGSSSTTMPTSSASLRENGSAGQVQTMETSLARGKGVSSSRKSSTSGSDSSLRLEQVQRTDPKSSIPQSVENSSPSVELAGSKQDNCVNVEPTDGTENSDAALQSSYSESGESSSDDDSQFKDALDSALVEINGNSASGSDKNSSNQVRNSASLNTSASSSGSSKGSNPSQHPRSVSKSSGFVSAGTSSSAVEVAESDLGLDRSRSGPEQTTRSGTSPEPKAENGAETAVVVRTSSKSSGSNFDNSSTAEEGSGANGILTDSDGFEEDNSVHGNRTTTREKSSDGNDHALISKGISRELSFPQNNSSSSAANSTEVPPNVIIVHRGDEGVAADDIAYDGIDIESESQDMFYDALGSIADIDSVPDSDNSMEAPSSSVVITSSRNATSSGQNEASGSGTTNILGSSNSSHSSQAESSEVEESGNESSVGEDGDSDQFLPTSE